MTPAEVEAELREYCGSSFLEPEVSLSELPLVSEPHVAVWQGYADAAVSEGLFRVLQNNIVQFRFPIQAGMSESPAYRAATRKAEWPLVSHPPDLDEPDGLELRIHMSPAGLIPVLIAATRSDFETLMRVFGGRNEPVDIPASQGAAILSGFNNIGRIRDYRDRWFDEHGADNPGWADAFKTLLAQKALYQDRFIVLSRGPYSGVHHRDLNVNEEEWLALSLEIRLHHECAHYFTRRVFGSMQNNLLDELIADYVGLRSACGRFKPEWFLRFMGLENYPEYRAGGRLENYRGDPRLSDAAFDGLQGLVIAAAEALARFDQDYHDALSAENGIARFLYGISGIRLDELSKSGVLEAAGAFLKGRKPF